MIIFAGSKEKGYFCQDVAKQKQMKCVYITENNHIANQVEKIINYKEQGKYIVYDIEQYIDDPDEIISWMDKVEKAINAKTIIYAAGYSPQAKLIAALHDKGMKNFIFTTYLSEQKEDLDLCISGYYENFGYEEKRGISFEPVEKEQKEEAHINSTVKAIGIAGSVERMGTTTQALQLIKYLLFKGYRACYIEMNNHGWVEKLAAAYQDIDRNEEIGCVTYQSVDMYYRAEKLQDVLKKNYDFFVYDYGVYSEHDFNKVSFLEKAVQIFVVGSKPSEFDKTYDVIKNNFYNQCNYIFNFVPENEIKDLYELMDDKAEFTFMAEYAPDPFTFCGSKLYEKILPVETKAVNKKKKKLFGRKKNKK